MAHICCTFDYEIKGNISAEFKMFFSLLLFVLNDGSSVAFSRSVGRFTTLVQTLAMTFCTGICGPQRMSPTNILYPLTFPLAPP